MMIRRAVLLVIALSLWSCSDGSSRLPEYELAGATMGTRFSVKLVAPGEAIDKNALQRQLVQTLARIEERMSTYVADSELSRFNASSSTDWIAVSDELCSIVESAIGISQLTGGAFDITVGPLVNLWGFGPDGIATEPPSEEDILRARHRVGFEKLDANCSAPAIRKLQPDVYVDLSAYAKGYAVDQLAELLDQAAFKDYLVEIGGELRMRGHNSSAEEWAIAVEKPIGYERDIQTVVRLTDSAMATSGDYRNYFEHHGNRYSHTIDSRTGRPVIHNLAAVTVVSDTAAFADAIATALLVLGMEHGFEFAERENIAAYFLLRNESGIEEHMTGLFAGLMSR
jgi:thiamine biosynthesis lipoprotein